MPMVNDLDIYRAAKVMLDEHGDGAEAEAKTRTQCLSGQGFAEGAAVWNRILAAVRNL